MTPQNIADIIRLSVGVAYGYSEFQILKEGQDFPKPGDKYITFDIVSEDAMGEVTSKEVDGIAGTKVTTVTWNTMIVAIRVYHDKNNARRILKDLAAHLDHNQNLWPITGHIISFVEAGTITDLAQIDRAVWESVMYRNFTFEYTDYTEITNTDLIDNKLDLIGLSIHPDNSELSHKIERE